MEKPKCSFGVGMSWARAFAGMERMQMIAIAGAIDFAIASDFAVDIDFVIATRNV